MRAGPESTAPPSITMTAPRASAGGANATDVDHVGDPAPNDACPVAASRWVPMVATSTLTASSTPYPGPLTVTGEVTCAPPAGDDTFSMPPGPTAPMTSQALPNRCSLTVVTLTGRFEPASLIVRPSVTVAVRLPRCEPMTWSTPSAST